MDRWVGKVAVVTGASAGIGETTVLTLAEKGIIVVALARREDKLKELAALTKGKIYPRRCDMSKEKDIIQTFAWVEKTLGGVDILINNAGVAKTDLLTAGDTSNWGTMWQTNVLGLSISTREAMKTMRKRGDDGHIIHINSVVGHTVPFFPTIGMYSASKHAVTALTEALRIELQGLNSNIKITSISPGSVYTEMARKFKASLTGGEVEPAGGPLPPAHLAAQDVTDAIVYCLGTRPLVQVHELKIQPIGQKYA